LLLIALEIVISRTVLFLSLSSLWHEWRQGEPNTGLLLPALRHGHGTPWTSLRHSY
jgi:hypothetical protein